MSRRSTPSTPPPSPEAIPWNNLFGVVACLLIFLVPFFPDEKNVRLKLEVLEIGIFLMTALSGAWIFFHKPEFTPPQKKVLAALGAWLAVGIGLWALSTEKSLASPELRRVLLAAGAFVSFAVPGLSVDWRRRFLLMWSFAGGLLSVYALLQVTGGAGMIMVPQFDRVIATFGNPIFYAAFLGPSLFVTWQARNESRNEALKFALLLFFLTQIAALYFTQTRAVWIGVLSAAGLGVLLRYGARRVPPAVYIVALLGLVLFGYATRNVWGRDQGHPMIWRDTARMWKDHPVKGVGLGAFHTNFISYAGDDLKKKWPQGRSIINYAHNEYLQMLAEGGVFWLLSFGAVLFFFWRLAFPGGAPLLGLAAVSLLVQNAGSVDMRFSVSFATLFMLMGLVFSDRKEDPASPEIKTASRLAMAAGWIAFMIAAVLPAILEPYKAREKVNAAVGFFDERLLDPAKSIGDLEKLADQYPKEPAVLEKLAFVYAKEMQGPDRRINQERTAQAVAAYKKVLELDAQRVSAYNNLANVYYTSGQTQSAIETWEKALVIKPDFIDVRLNLGKIYYVQGKLKDAAEHFEQVLRLDPNNAEAIVYMKRMVE